MGIEELLKAKREEILQIAARHGAYNVRVFGSVARGDARPNRDADFLAHAGPTRSPFRAGPSRMIREVTAGCLSVA